MINKKLKKHYIIYLFAIIQTYLFIIGINSYKNEEYNKVDTSEIDEIISFENLHLELSTEENIEIIEFKKDIKNKWSGTINISGDYEEIKKGIEKLEKYEIIEYYIEGNEGIFNIILDVCR